MADKPEQADVRIHVQFDDSSRYGWQDKYAHVYARPMILAWGERGERKLDLWDADSYSIPFPGDSVRALARMRVTSQIDNTSRGFYGIRVEYEPSGGTVDLRDVETMLQPLRRVAKGMDKLAETFGRPQDLPAFLAHFAHVLIPKQPRPFMRAVTYTGHDDDYEGSGYRSMEPDVMRWWIDDQLKAWRERNGISVPE